MIIKNPYKILRKIKQINDRKFNLKIKIKLLQLSDVSSRASFHELINFFNKFNTLTRRFLIMTFLAA